MLSRRLLQLRGSSERGQNKVMPLVNLSGSHQTGEDIQPQFFENCVHINPLTTVKHTKKVDHCHHDHCWTGDQGIAVGQVKMFQGSLMTFCSLFLNSVLTLCFKLFLIFQGCEKVNSDSFCNLLVASMMALIFGAPYITIPSDIN